MIHHLCPDRPVIDGAVMFTACSGDETNGAAITFVQQATPAAAALVLAADDRDGNLDGRSPWFWVRTASDDLMLACFPYGDTYCATETDRDV